MRPVKALRLMRWIYVMKGPFALLEQSPGGAYHCPICHDCGIDFIFRWDGANMRGIGEQGWCHHCGAALSFRDWETFRFQE